MKKKSKPGKQPHQEELQPPISALNGGRPAEAEAAAKQLLQRYPKALMVHNILGIARERQQKFDAAARSYRRALEIDPSVAEIQFNLGVTQERLGTRDEAIRSYRRAIRLKPGLTVAHFNLGIALQNQDRLEESAACYRAAIAQQPGFVEAHANLGAVLQRQGRWHDAITCYHEALAIRDEAVTRFNLGTAQRNLGELEQAADSFRRALSLNPEYAEAHSNLGDVHWHQGRINEAVTHFRKALAIDPDNRLAHYNLGVFLYDNKELEQALPHFRAARIHDWRERALYCLYKTERFDEFRENLDEALQHNSKSPLLATLSSHHAINFGTPDPCAFCPNPLDFVYHGRIPELAEPGSPLLAALLRDIEQQEIAEREQSRLHHGRQSAGNLFMRPEASFRELAGLIARTVREYYEQHQDADCEFIRQFPGEITFNSAWYVKMRRGGYLDSHIHEDGWISGSVYLSIPTQVAGDDEGCIELSMHGDGYPKRHDNFPTRLVPLAVGDVCFFPSSVFHRTIPFDSDEPRICIAFDVKPAP